MMANQFFKNQMSVCLPSSLLQLCGHPWSLPYGIVWQRCDPNLLLMWTSY